MVESTDSPNTVSRVQKSVKTLENWFRGQKNWFWLHKIRLGS